MTARCSSGRGVAMETAAGPVAMVTAAPPGGGRHALLAVIGEIGTEPERGALRGALERGEHCGRGRAGAVLPAPRAAELRACRVVFCRRPGRGGAAGALPALRHCRLAEGLRPAPPGGTAAEARGRWLREGSRRCRDRGAEAEAEAVGPGGARAEGEAGRGSEPRRSAGPVSAASHCIPVFFSPDHCFYMH